MRKIVSFIMMIGFVFAGLVKESYEVKGMHCQFGCANKVQSMMANLEGVEKCEVDFESSKMLIEYDDSKLNTDVIISTITTNTTYETKKIDKNEKKKSFWSKLKGLFG